MPLYLPNHVVTRASLGSSIRNPHHMMMFTSSSRMLPPNCQPPKLPLEASNAMMLFTIMKIENTSTAIFTNNIKKPFNTVPLN